MKEIWLCLSILTVGALTCEGQESKRTYNTVGINYMIWYVPEGFAADHHTYMLEWRQAGTKGWYVRPHAKVGFGHYWSFSDITGEKFLDDRFRKAYIGASAGIVKKYLGFRFTNDIGMAKFNEWGDLSFLTCHELSIHSGHALKRLECSVSMPLYLITVDGFSSLGFLNASLLYKF